MKKNIFLLAIMLLCIIGCTDKNSYKVTGTIENASDGEQVFLQKVAGRDLIKIDSATITGQKFTFTGRQDSAVNRYITYGNESGNQQMTDFFLENGNINVALGTTTKVGGTPTNDNYQAFKDKVTQIRKEQQAAYESLQNQDLTSDQRDAKVAEVRAKDEEMNQLIAQTIEANIQNTIGVHLLGQYNYMMDFTEIEPLLAKVPAQFQNNERIAKLKNQVAIEKNVAVGKKFTDLEMQTPEGNMVKLSDFIGKNKYTLVDFWASWCGPCRREMPKLIEAYDKYNKKGFGIVGVSFDRDLDSWQKGIKALNITWPQMSDLKFWESEGARLYSVRSIPHTVLIDQEGTIIAKGLRGDDIDGKLAELLK